MTILYSRVEIVEENGVITEVPCTEILEYGSIQYVLGSTELIGVFSPSMIYTYIVPGYINVGYTNILIN